MKFYKRMLKTLKNCQKKKKAGLVESFLFHVS